MFAIRIFRDLATLAVVLALAACAGNVSGSFFSIGSSSQSVLRNTLLSEQSRRSLSLSDEVLAFYQSRNFQPAWTASASQREMARAVREVLARAHEQGLRDEEYKLADEHFDSQFASARAKYELALTSAVLRYSHDVRTGRFRPSDVYDDVELPGHGFDAAAALNQAQQNGSVKEYLAGLPPLHPQYRELVKALAQYRAIADDGGWPSVPVQNAIRFDDNDPGTVTLIGRLGSEDPVLAATPKPSTAQLRDAVKRFQARNGLDDDGVVGSRTIAALNVSASSRATQIAANMERWRWMPRQFERRYVAVNVADQSLELTRDGEIALTSRVIVGQKTSMTPITRATIEAIVVNPPWNIPGDIAARALLPRLRQNANYLASRNMVVTNGRPNDPYGRTIDWKKVIPAEFPYAIRQLPGPTAALGALMLDSPNDFDVYLHDTPNKNLFDLSEREISNGCVRVQEIFPLASLALTGNVKTGMEKLTDATRSRRTQRLELDSPLPVYFLYWTALARPDGRVEFRPDRYGRDIPLVAALSTTNISAITRNRELTAMSRDSSPVEELSP